MVSSIILLTTHRPEDGGLNTKKLTLESESRPAAAPLEVSSVIELVEEIPCQRLGSAPPLTIDAGLTIILFKERFPKKKLKSTTAKGP